MSNNLGKTVRLLGGASVDKLNNLTFHSNAQLDNYVKEVNARDSKAEAWRCGHLFFLDRGQAQAYALRHGCGLTELFTSPQPDQSAYIKRLEESLIDIRSRLRNACSMLKASEGYTGESVSVEDRTDTVLIEVLNTINALLASKGINNG